MNLKLGEAIPPWQVAKSQFLSIHYEAIDPILVRPTRPTSVAGVAPTITSMGHKSLSGSSRLSEWGPHA